jgi:hypothetical protein
MVYDRGSHTCLVSDNCSAALLRKQLYHICRCLAAGLSVVSCIVLYDSVVLQLEPSSSVFLLWFCCRAWLSAVSFGYSKCLCSGVRVLGEQCVLKDGGGLLLLWGALQLL